MAKRTIEDSKIEDSKIDFNYDDEEDQLRKKIKLESKKIVSKIKEIDEGINISEHEVQKFLLIFHTVMQTVNSELKQEETDGAVNDALKKIKCLFIPQTKDHEVQENAKETSETSG